MRVNAAGDIGYFYKPQSYVDVSTGENLRLAYPHKDPGDDWGWGFVHYSVTSGNFLGRGEPQIAVAFGHQWSTAILLFDAAGKCLYYQEMGCLISDVTCMHANGKDHLVVLARNKVLIYP
jgi:hypothetical protein